VVPRGAGNPAECPLICREWAKTALALRLRMRPPESMSLNACELEIDLFCNGMRVPEDVSLEGVRGLARTRAGLGSGLDLAIQTRSRMKPEVWVNVPVVEQFARSSPYCLVGGPDTGYHIVDERDRAEYRVRLPKEPTWYEQHTSSDVPMQRIG